MKGELEKDAKNWKKGTTEVGKLPETTVQINQKPCHFCYPECFQSIVNRIKNFFLFNWFTLKFYVPVITTCLKLGLVGIGKGPCGIIPHFFSGQKCPVLFCVQSDGHCQSEGLSVVSLKERM